MCKARVIYERKNFFAARRPARASPTLGSHLSKNPHLADLDARVRNRSASSPRCELGRKSRYFFLRSFHVGSRGTQFDPAPRGSALSKARKVPLCWILSKFFQDPIGSAKICPSHFGFDSSIVDTIQQYQHLELQCLGSAASNWNALHALVTLFIPSFARLGDVIRLGEWEKHMGPGTQSGSRLCGCGAWQRKPSKNGEAWEGDRLYSCSRTTRNSVNCRADDTRHGPYAHTITYTVSTQYTLEEAVVAACTYTERVCGAGVLANEEGEKRRCDSFRGPVDQ
ncbi:hypothetical protein DFH06DRAFT_1134955 [Mycena polygramma]|nr:hypothetical protein DFH06DRAFT_1134955 [Mycena polygramma]